MADALRELPSGDGEDCIRRMQGDGVASVSLEGGVCKLQELTERL